jgi:type VI secretion system protein ImpK
MSDTDDPFRARSSTILRPQPGGGPRPGTGSAPATPVGGIEPASGAPGVATPVASGAQTDLRDFLTSGRNPLLAAANPLLVLGSRLQLSVDQADVAGLHRSAMDQVRAFEATARAAGASPDDVLVARYVLCTFLDTAVYRTPWGAESDWSQKPLLVQFHDESNGGVKFFEILERIEGQSERYLDLLELLYVCLALGYEGRYRNDRAQLIAIQDRLLRIIRGQRGTVSAASISLSPRWQGVQDARKHITRLVPWWLTGLASLVLVMSVWIGLRYQLSQAATPVVQRFAGYGIDIDYAAPAAAMPSRLKVLLADDEFSGALRVEEFGSRSLVTLSGGDLFPSASAALNPSYASALARISTAMEAVPGRITVVGHTDDVPIRSLRFQDNFHLSRERALSVAVILRSRLSDPARVEWTGVGETEPRYRPADDPRNRARNRRVEIIHDASDRL